MSDYYNTTSLSGPELKRSKEKAASQCEIVLGILMCDPQNSHTAYDIWLSSDNLKHAPQSSVRRALHSLESLSLVEKTNEKRLAGYGKVNYCWRLVK